MRQLYFLLLPFLFSLPAAAQSVDEDQLGAWYMYFYQADFGEDSKFGIQGDFQFRYWDFGSDLEQVLLRSGLTYRPDNVNALLTLGYASITSGVPGESSATSHENRIYQEALLPHRLSKRLALTHRFRYEQRWVEGQDFRTRYRYNLFVNIFLNAENFGKGTLNVALYNELFINGQRDIGNDREVQYFDRNRTYLGLGYGLRDNLRFQLGWMQQTTAAWQKGQMHFSLHHNFGF